MARPWSAPPCRRRFFERSSPIATPSCSCAPRPWARFPLSLQARRRSPRPTACGRGLRGRPGNVGRRGSPRPASGRRKSLRAVVAFSDGKPDATFLKMLLSDLVNLLLGLVHVLDRSVRMDQEIVADEDEIGLGKKSRVDRHAHVGGKPHRLPPAPPPAPPPH